MLTLYMKNVDFIRFVDVNGNMEIISSPLYIYHEKNSSKLLVTFDDECLMIQKQNFIIRAENFFQSCMIIKICTQGLDNVRKLCTFDGQEA